MTELGLIPIFLPTHFILWESKTERPEIRNRQDHDVICQIEVCGAATRTIGIDKMTEAECNVLVVHVKNVNDNDLI